jgi:cell division protein FtsX
MEKIKNFVRNISKTGWIIISVVVVVLILTLVGILLVKRGVDIWPFNNGSSNKQEIASDKEALANLNNGNQSTNDSVFSAEDVMSGKYSNSVEAAKVFVDNTREVKVAVVFDEKQSEVAKNQKISCGKLTFVSARVPNKTGIINETLKAIFADRIATDFLPGNIIPKYHPNLVFDKATIENGVVQVYLKGDFSVKEEGKCGISLAVSEITETVKQFEGVKSVEIYQNLNKIN